MLVCPACQSTNIAEEGSKLVCQECAIVLDESAIVSDVTFAENSAGGAVVQGSYVSNDQRGARTQGPGGYGGSGQQSRDQTIMKAKHEIKKIALAKGVPASTADKASKMFTLALAGGTWKGSGDEPANYVLGRRSEYTQASCLYVACRMDATNHMLIDFADALSVNVFVLGRSYLRLVRCLGLRVPVIDPAIYISRFASLLDFGDDTQRVATDATRLVQRFKKDWIVHGRRPAGVCGACLLLAARMNNYRRSIAEIIQVVKIADVTLKKRLDEFQQTSSSRLSIDDFRNIWLEEESEPPSFYLARMKKNAKPKTNGKTVGGTAGDDEATSADEGEEREAIDPRLEALADEATRQEIARYLTEDAAKEAQLSEAIAIKQSQVQNGHALHPMTNTEDALDDLDEEELDQFLLTEDEVRIKERVWMEFNKDWLEKQLERHLKAEADQKAGIQPKAPRRKRSAQPRDSSTAPSTAAESTKEMMRKKNFSRRINKDAVDKLLAGGSALPDMGGSSRIAGKRTFSDEEDEEEVEDAIMHANNVRSREYADAEDDDEEDQGSNDSDDIERQEKTNLRNGKRGKLSSPTRKSAKHSNKNKQQHTFASESSQSKPHETARRSSRRSKGKGKGKAVDGQVDWRTGLGQFDANGNLVDDGENEDDDD